MVHLNEMYLLSASVELFAAMITGILLIGCLIERRVSSATDKLLVSILVVQIVALLSDAVSWLCISPTVQCGVLVLQVLYLSNYVFGCALISLYAYYLVMHISQLCKISLWYARGTAIGCGVASVLWVISIFNGMYVSFDSNAEEQLGPMFWLSQTLAVLLPASTMFVAFKFRKIMGLRDTIVMMLYGLLPILACPLQLFWLTTPLLLATTLSLVLVYTIVHMEENKRAVEQKKLLAEKELELSESRISIMLSQIQPHFLYNALTTIKHLCGKQDPRAENVVASFAKYLRGNMDSLSNKAPIPFRSELMHLESYLAIETLRFPQVHIVYDLSVRDFFIPALTVQPIVENAIRYGVTRKKDGAGTITVSSWEDAEAYYVRVADDGVGFDPMQKQYDGRSHIGILNTKQRLEAMCGGSLSIDSKNDVGTTVTIFLPKERSNENTVCG